MGCGKLVVAMQVLTTSPEIDNAIVSPSNWGNEKWMHDQFAWLRENDPLKCLSPEGFEPFWNVTKYADIKTIEGNKKLLSTIPGPPYPRNLWPTP